jgi:hypothetical protein
MSVSGGLLSEELLDHLTDYRLAFMGEDALAQPTAVSQRCDSSMHSPGLQGAAATAAAAACDAAGLLDVGCAYYFADVTRQLNSRFGDLQHKIQDLEVSTLVPGHRAVHNRMQIKAL